MGPPESIEETKIFATRAAEMYSAMNIDEALSLTSGGILMQLIVVLQAPASALGELRGGKYIHMVAE